MRRIIARILRKTADRIAPQPTITVNMTAWTQGFSTRQVEQELRLRGGYQ